MQDATNKDAGKLSGADTVTSLCRYGMNGNFPLYKSRRSPPD